MAETGSIRKEDLLRKVEQHNAKEVLRSPFSCKDRQFVEHDTVFGISKGVAGQLLVFGDSLIAFAVSRSIVIRDISKKTQRFIQREGRFRNITLLAGVMAGTKEESYPLLLVGDSSTADRCSQVVMVACKESAQFRVFNTGGKGRIVQLDLDAKKQTLLCLQNTELSSRVLVFRLERERLSASVELKYVIQELSFHAVFSKEVLLMSEKHIKQWSIKLQEKELKETKTLVSSKELKQQKLVSHQWVNCKSRVLVVLTEEQLADRVLNRVLVLEKDEVRVVVELNTEEIKHKLLSKQKKQHESIEEGLGVEKLFQDMVRDNVNNRGEVLERETNEQYYFTCFARKGELRHEAEGKSGFVLGGSHGMVVFFELEHKTMRLLHGLCYSIEDRSVINSLSSSHNESLLTVVSRNQRKQLFYYTLNTYLIDADEQALLPFFGHSLAASPSYHSRKVRALSCSLMKSLFVSCSLDYTVKLWNYEEIEALDKRCMQNFRCESNELASGVALHPFGLLLAVSFEKEFRVFAILEQSLLPILSVKQNRFLGIKYSHGGHFLVTNEGMTLKVYDSIYYRVLHIFTIEDIKGQIKEFVISQDDSLIVVLFQEDPYIDKKSGSEVEHLGECFVFRWVLAEELAKQEYSHKVKEPYLGIEYDPHVVVNDRVEDLFLAYSHSRIVLYKNRIKELFCEFNVASWSPSCVLLSKELGVVLFGTSHGAVRVYPWPLNETTCPYSIFSYERGQLTYSLPEYFEFSFHSHEVTTLCLTDNRKRLIAGCEDGTIYLLRLNLEDPRAKDSTISNKQADERRSMLQITNKFFLMSSKDVAEKNDRIRRNEMEILRADQNAKAEREKREREFDETFEKKKKDFQATIANELKLKEEYIEKDEKEYHELEAQYQDELLEFKRRKKELLAKHRERMDYEERRNRELEKEIEDEKQRHQRTLEDMLREYKQSIYWLKKDYVLRSQSLQSEYNETVRAASIAGEQFMRELQAEEEVQEQELDSQMNELRERIGEIRTSNEQLEKSNRELKEEFKDLKIRDEEAQRDFQFTFEKYIEIREENLRNDQEILKMQHQLLERLQVIDLKEEAWRSAKEYKVTLQNFRYLLDQKIRELQEQKQGLLEKIKSKEATLSKMFSELIKESQENEAKERKISSVRSQIRVIQNEARQCELSVFQHISVLANLRKKLEEALREEDEVKVGREVNRLLDELRKQRKERQTGPVSVVQLKEAIKQRHEKGSDLNEDLLKHNNWMNKKLHLMKSTSKKIKEIRQDNINIVLRQNQKLIEECNLLRTENEAYSKEIRKADILLVETVKSHERLKEMRKDEREHRSSPKLGDLEKKVLQQRELLQQQRENLNRLLRERSES